MFKLLVCLLLLPIVANAQSPLLWQKTYGGSNDDGAASIIQTSDGGFIFAGSTSSNDGDVIGLHPGGNDDLWVVKLSADDSIQWEIPFGGSKRDNAYSIVQTFDGGYAIAGSTSSNDGDVSEGTFGGDDYWVIKLTASGGIEWQKTFGGSMDDDAYCIIQTSDSGFAVAGRTFSHDSEVTLNHGSEDYWILKLNSQGQLIWQKALGSPGADEAHAIVQTYDGGYAVAGWAGTDGGNVTNEHGSADFWVVKLSATGQLDWQKAYGGSNGDFAYSIVQTLDSGFAITGSTTSDDSDVQGLHSADTSDVWLIKIGKTGLLQWQRTLGGSGRDAGQSIVQTEDGGFAVAGYTNSMDGDVTPIVADSGTFDGWFMRVDSAGRLLWQETLGGLADDFLYSLCRTKDRGYVLAGTSNSLLTEGGGFAGNQNAWVVRLAEEGSLVHGDRAFLDRGTRVFPNPASGRAQIYYTIDKPSVVRVEIYNGMGQIVCARKLAGNTPGNHVASFDLSMLPSGVYHYSIFSSDKVESGHFQSVR